MPIRSMLAIVAATLLALTSITAVQAQAPDSPPLEDGDIVWAFANEEPFFDSRVAGALGTLMAPIVDSEAPDGMQIVRVESNGPDLVGATIYPTDDVPLLLAAAGYDPMSPFSQVGECRYWTPPADTAGTGIPWNTPASPAGIVIEALQDALASLGVPRMACTETSNPDEAHVLFWVQGETPPTLMQRDEATFLAGTNVPSAPVTPLPGQESVPSEPGPAATGNAGLQDDGRGHRSALLMAIGFMTGALLLGSRLVTRRRRSDR